MTYQQVLDLLYSCSQYGIKLGLKNTKSFLKHLNLLRLKTPIIHIAGTNGKGSTAMMIHKILEEHGYRSGLFTSPHIHNFCERIRINQKLIRLQEISSFIQQHQNKITAIGLTFFEVTTCLAIWYFEQRNCDFIILETGMGGRFDATNCFLPKLTIITNVSMDHENYLGNTIEKIIHEKAGIIKKNIPILSADISDFVQKKIKVYALQKNAPYYDLRSSFQIPIQTSLLGEHQKRNAHTALEAAKKLLQTHFSIEKTTCALKKVRWSGRIEIWKKCIILDVSHNLAGVTNSIQTIKETFPKKKFVCTYAFLDDKNTAECLKIIKQLTSKLYPYPLEHTRFTNTLQNNNEKFFNPKIQVSTFLKKHRSDYLLCIGSHYLVEAFTKKISL